MARDSELDAQGVQLHPLRSVSDLATEQSRQALFDLSIRSDFLGQTGRVRQFNGVDVVTTPPSLGDRDGIVLLRQVTSNPEDAFIQLAFRTSQGLSFKSNISWSPTDATKMLFCQGSACDFEQGWIPADFYNDCEAGEFWSSDLGCSHCAPGFFSPPQSTEPRLAFRWPVVDGSKSVWLNVDGFH